MYKTLKCRKIAVLSFSLVFLLAVVFLAFGAVLTHAAPANPFPFEFTQSDGREINLFMRGDEFFSWWEDENGFIVAYNESSGDWHYAYVINETIQPAGQVVGLFDASLTHPFTRIIRSDILHLIQNTWRFDPGNPVLEFLNGRIFRDHRGSANVAVVSVPIVPALFPGGQDGTSSVPGSPNVVAPGTGGSPGSLVNPPGVQPPIVIPPSTDDGDGDGPAIIGFASPSPSAASFGFAGSTFANIAIASSAASNTPQIPLNQRLLVLLVEFDNAALAEDSAFYFNKYFNTSPGVVSVANYFRDMSGGRNIFVPAGNVTAEGTFAARMPNDEVSFAANGVNITLTPSIHNGIVHARVHMNHPVTRWSQPQGHKATRAVVSLILSAIHENSDFNFNNINVAAVFAGGEASDNFNPGGQIWAHAWSFRGSVVGQTGWLRYMAYGERQRGGQVMGIGHAVHELGHVLGLPDLYDLTGQSEGIGPYSLMGLGNWGRGPGDPAVGHRPTALDPWSRIQLGFIHPTVVSGNTWTGNVYSAGVRNHNILKIMSPASSTQFFLVENRHVSGTWDMGLAQWIRNNSGRGGIIVYHVDESMRSENISDLTMNNNNRNRLMVGVREADGSNLLSNSVVRWNTKIDHFFSAGEFWSFNATTNPSSNFFAASGRNTLSGIEIIIHDERDESMEVEVIINR